MKMMFNVWIGRLNFKIRDTDAKHRKFYALESTIASIYIYIERERESYAMVSREVQNIFVLRIVSSIFKFKTPIQPLKVFSILKYIWNSNFIYIF
jgi:hypothetical protein